MNTIKTAGAPVFLYGVNYETYAQIRDEPHNEKLRLTYYDGTLEIMAPADYRHEWGSYRLSMIVNAYAFVFEIETEGALSTTFRNGVPGQPEGAGKEPDLSFYFADHAEHVRNKETLDLKIDPAPDLWIEVDNKGSSNGSLPLYVEPGVPEVWRDWTRRRKLWFGSLRNGSFVEIQRSLCLPKVTPNIVLEMIDEARKRGQTAWDIWMRNWMDTSLRNAND